MYLTPNPIAKQATHTPTLPQVTRSYQHLTTVPVCHYPRYIEKHLGLAERGHALPCWLRCAIV